ncbi:hypothetical protein Phi13:2_gp122 [Cellulophaga phage phi13:2]|uniref:Uncharacterized protein n=1 Tax=Cellulophaga phage phi13:2 TaxID=1328030 RepID=S0A5S6_9CAUD|nr:hypothetical protein Phi13:2_gp122 [Cellulophaga phage phi13:2]AGO49732.1 hypothetical protein Phi13:2_gp122 [Cellulophaga phage phi13:2]
MKTRLLENSDYETLVTWWGQNRFPSPNFDDLPTVNGELQGVMVYFEDVEICAGFIINTTVKNGAMIEYIVANFNVKDKQLRKDAIKLLTDTLCDLGRNMGKKYLFTSVKNKGLVDKLLYSGFSKGSTGTIEMIKII